MTPPRTSVAISARPRVVGSDGPTERTIIEAAERLATPSSVVLGVLELLDAATPRRIVAARLGQSPDLAAQVLHLANSALFRHPCDTIERVIARLGEQTVRGLLLASATHSLMESGLPVYGLPRLALIKHSNEVAQISRGITSRSAAALQAQSSVAGLLHDLGKPILAAVAAEGMASVSPYGDTEGERRVFGTDHPRVGAWIARRWGLSDEICDAIQYHHAPIAPEEPLGRAVWLADGAAHASHGDERARARLRDMAEAGGMSRGEMESVLAGSPETVAPRCPPGLTNREAEVLRVLATGAMAKQVAHKLGCSTSTVHNHLHRVYRKFGVSGQAQALLHARDKGWI